MTRIRTGRRRHRGSNLAIFCAMGALLVGFLGIAIYTGLQVFLQHDLQRMTSNAAMAGAAAYYSAIGANNKPTPNPDQAKNIARSVFNGIAGSTSVGGFGATIVNVTNNDANDSITVTSRANIDTPFLAVIGINAIEANATATAHALKYEPTQYLTNGIQINPVSTNLGSYSATLQLSFPLVDGPGIDLYVEQPANNQQAYVVEACNETQCYDLMPAARPVGTARNAILADGTRIFYGSTVYDLSQAGVRKASRLRFTHGNEFSLYSSGTLQAAPAAPTPLTFQRVMLYGYAGTCANANTCPIPAGFMPVE